jgi:hypothetical protein
VSAFAAAGSSGQFDAKEAPKPPRMVQIPQERCQRAALPGALWTGALELPSVVWRLEAHLLAWELAQVRHRERERGGGRSDGGQWSCRRWCGGWRRICWRGS